MIDPIQLALHAPLAWRLMHLLLAIGAEAPVDRLAKALGVEPLDLWLAAQTLGEASVYVQVHQDALLLTALDAPTVFQRAQLGVELRAAYARRALPRLHALRREAFALARLGERLRADAARIVGPDPRERGYRPDVERRGDLQTQDDHERWDGTDDAGAPGFADLLRAADAHLLEAERLAARARAAFGGDDDARVLVRPDAEERDYDAEHLVQWGESDINDDDETDMSDADEEEEAAAAAPAKKSADA